MAKLSAQDIVERLRNADANSQQRTLGSRIFGEAADTISRLTADNEALRKTNEHWRRQSRDCFEAFSAMRDAINEVVPMQSAEADLLEGPEMFVSCEAVATAVISHVRATSARADALAQALRAIVDVLDAEEMGEGPPASEWSKHWQKLHDDARAALANEEAGR